MNELKEALLKEYHHFANRRIKRLEKGWTFVVDDRRATDEGADGNLLSYFCMIFVDIVSPAELKVRLQGNVPDSPAVQSWAKTHHAAYRGGVRQTLKFQIGQGEQARLRSLARAIRSIVAPGAPRYTVTSYKYVCPRTAVSLERLADTLDRLWSI